jgi:pentatricopeptide repeat protein
MIMEGLRPEKFTYDSLLAHFYKVGILKKAADIVQTMASDGCEPDIVTYGTLIAGQCKASRDQIKDIVLNPVIQARFRQKRSKEAVKLFRDMIEKAEALGVVTYKIVFCGLCRGREEAVDFVLERGNVPELSTFYMFAEGPLALAMEGTLVKLVDMIMEKAKHFS